MPHPSKTKGNSFERELVNDARGRGMKADRAYASNGESLGESEEVDCLINGARVQAKRRGRLPAYLKVPGGCDVVAFREDRGTTWALMRWADFLELIDEGF